jgi:hypothetical protein
VGHLLAKLGVADRVKLVVFAYEHELVRPGRQDDPPPTAADRRFEPGGLDGRRQSAR